jgi:hypothetical protein
MYILVPVIAILMIMVVVSLVKGIVAFMNSTRLELNRAEDDRATEMQMVQNKMMLSRIKYQAAAVLVVALLAGLAKS